jgi:hypothetical protein
MLDHVISRRCLAVVATAAAALVTATVANAQTPNPQLLRTYQPVMVFDKTEQFRPASVQSFIADSVLERLDGGSWTVVDPDPEPGDLPGPGTGTWRLNQESCNPASALGGLSCYADAAASGSGASTVYARVVRLENAIVLQYWFFYYDDVYTYFYPLHPFVNMLWQAHEGDWEVVNVVLSADEQPLEVGYSQHCLGQRRGWETTPRVDDTHPVVYVATGSHANYLSPGVYPFDRRCVPPPVIGLLEQNRLPLPNDFAGGDGAVAGPKAAGGELTTIKHVDEETPTWLSFPGSWGEAQYFHSPQTGAVALGTSPVGPAYHEVWVDPLGTLAAWPAG